MLRKVKVGGVNSYGFYVLTSEFDNVCNVKGIPNSFLSFGNAYVCKLADIEKKSFLFTDRDGIIIQV